MSRPSSIAVGQVHGRLTVEGPPERRGEHTYWPCRCSCGGSTIVRNTTLTRGESRSCGCLRRDRPDLIIHGNTGKAHSKRSPEYRTWLGMRCRCEKPTDLAFPNYGGRGITVCERWRSSFPNFLADMGPKPSPKHSIDRIDVNGNYEPANCRWATIDVQANNRRPTRRQQIQCPGCGDLFEGVWAETCSEACRLIVRRSGARLSRRSVAASGSGARA